MTISYPPDNVIISDSTVLINFIESGQFKILLEVYQGGIHITTAVNGEVRYNRGELEAAINAGEIHVHDVPLEQVEHLCRSFSKFNLGEASCLELARENHWCVATDDGAAKGHIKTILGSVYVITTFDIVLRAVRMGFVSKKSASDVIKSMEDKANFLFSEATYREFLSNLRNS